MTAPKVIGEYETIATIIEHKVSIARFGDGEIKLCRGRRQISQRPSRAIKDRLRNILITDQPNLLVGVPNIWSKRNWLSERKENFWKRYRHEKNTKYYKRGKEYYSAFISRPDAAMHIDSKEYWCMCRCMWLNRNVVLIRGEANAFSKDPSIFMGAKSVEALLAPKTNAFEEIDSILDYCRKYDRSTLFVLSLGPTATILAADLCSLGYQALDLGHMGMMYSKAHHYYTKGAHAFDVKRKLNKPLPLEAKPVSP